MALTPKQERFYQEWRKDRNATQAAKRAGYSEKTAYSQGQRLLKKAEIRKRIAADTAKTAEKAGMSVQSVMEEIGDACKLAKRRKNVNALMRGLEMKAKHVGAFEKDNVQRAFVLEIG